jgi:hypothetical protein
MEEAISIVITLASNATCRKELRKELFNNGQLANALGACSSTAEASQVSDIVFKRLADLEKADEWDEFKTKSCANWKRIRAAIEHENNLINHRLTWLFASQLILFGGFFTIMQSLITKDLKLLQEPLFQSLLLLFPIVGVSVSVIILVSLHAATKQIGSLEDWWFCNHLDDISSVREPRDMLNHKEPPINGIFDMRVYHILSVRWLPLPIIVGWTLVASALWLHRVVSLQQSFMLSSAITTTVIFAGWLAWKQLQKPAGSDRWKRLIDRRNNRDGMLIGGTEQQHSGGVAQPRP